VDAVACNIDIVDRVHHLMYLSALGG
jgi:hypothetical protein